MRYALLKIYYTLGTLKKDKSLINSSDVILKHLSEIYSDFSLKRFNLSFESFSFYSESNIKDDLIRLKNLSSELLQNFDCVLFLGGDHSISYATISAFKEQYQNGKVVIFDAHPDVESDFFISHEDYLRILINQNILSPSDVLLVGLRNASKEEMDFLREKNIQYLSALDLYQNRKLNKQTNVQSFLKDVKEIHLSIDNDVFDFGFATGYYEPLGLSLFQFLSIIEQFKPKIKSVDIVEYYPSKDLNEINAKNLAKIIFHLFSE